MQYREGNRAEDTRGDVAAYSARVGQVCVLHSPSDYRLEQMLEFGGGCVARFGDTRSRERV